MPRMHSGISSVAFQPNTHSCDKTHTCICPGCQGCQASDNFRKEHWSPDHMSSFRTDDSACVWMCVCVCVCLRVLCVCICCFTFQFGALACAPHVYKLISEAFNAQRHFERCIPAKHTHSCDVTHTHAYAQDAQRHFERCIPAKHTFLR
jgi:hypothetical protein